MRSKYTGTVEVSLSEEMRIRITMNYLRKMHNFPESYYIEDGRVYGDPSGRNQNNQVVFIRDASEYDIYVDKIIANLLKRIK